MHERGHVLAVGRYRREPGSVSKARRAAVQAYAAYPTIDGALVALLVSEAVTNAVLHAAGPDFDVLCLSPSPIDGSVQIEVHDRSRVMPCQRRAAELDEDGRGLALLDLLAAAWRTERTTTGKCLIFTLEGGKCPA
jgi:anti-sigma regulatory factor (Ser/Thr protein kinase)